MSADWQAKKAGDEAARARMIEAHLYLIPVTRARFCRRSPERLKEDLEQAGRIGLVKAIDSFDPERGTEFVSWAITRIRGAMLQFLRDDDWVPRRDRTRQRQGEPIQIQQQISLQSLLLNEADLQDITLLESLADETEPPE